MKVPEKIVAADVSGAENRAAYDSSQVYHSHNAHFICSVARPAWRSEQLAEEGGALPGEKSRPDLPSGRSWRVTSRRFAVKYCSA